MRIITDAKSLGLKIAALEDIDPAALEPAKAYQSEEIKLVDGRPVYRLPDLYVKDGDYKASISIKVFNKPAEKIAGLTYIVLTGKVEITPFIMNNRIAYSVVADSVEVAK
ncbi:MAG: hypothetical protein LKI21_00305 [Bifidobacterium crudilactis]|jgi:hypothetical protein|nr:hypothetical protein [Bifidobacterium crudilactis]